MAPVQSTTNGVDTVKNITSDQDLKVYSTGDAGESDVQPKSDHHAYDFVKGEHFWSFVLEIVYYYYFLFFVRLNYDGNSFSFNAFRFERVPFELHGN